MALLSGDITGLEVPHLFQALRTGRKTGTAVFELHEGRESGKTVKKAYFREGDLLFASSNLEEDRLGEYLLRIGKITKPQYDASVELIKKTNKKQGAILVELGFITPPALVDSVKQQVKEIVLGLLSWRAGAYRFDEGPLPVADIIPLQMSIGNLVLEGMRKLDWTVARKALPPLPEVLRPAADASALFQRADLTTDEAAVFSLIDGKHTIEQICGSSGTGDFNTLRAIHLLLALRMVEPGKIKSKEDRIFAKEVVRETVAERKMPEGPAPAEQVITKDMIREAFEDMAGQDNFLVLGITRAATAQEIKKAYFRLAKLYHPDRHHDPEMSDMKPTLEGLFERITEAYNTLSDKARRNEYEISLSRPAKKTEFEEKHAEEYVENYQEKANRAAEQFNNGLKDYKSGNYWGAVEAFTWAVRLDPVKSAYFFYHGLTLARIPRRRHEAEESLLKAIEIDPSKMDYYLELGNMYLKSGLKSRAIAVFNDALKVDPNAEKIQAAIQAAGGAEERKEHPAAAEKVGGFRNIFGKKA